MTRPTSTITAALFLLVAGACQPAAPPTPAPGSASAPVPPFAHATQESFWGALQRLCGMAFPGRLVEGNPSDSAFASAQVVMHVRQCSPGEIRIPLHVGDNRSRTWILTRTSAGIRLKHDHRHEDGSEDTVTQYGGDTRDGGTATRQEFPADAFTGSLIPYAATNVWSMEVVPGRFSYALRREGRRFRVDFDLGNPVAAPPAPWGYPPLGQ
jgi:hypothetical protein